MPNQNTAQVQFPEGSSRFTLSPGYELVICKKQIYGIFVYKETRIISINSNEFSEMFKLYMPYWAAYFGENFKELFIKAHPIDFKLDHIAVTGLHYILEEERSAGIPNIEYEIRSWIHETLDNI